MIIALKAVFADAGEDTLAFLTRPTGWLVSLFTPGSFQWVPGTGSYHAAADILINKGCSGYNFMLLCFSIAVFRWVPGQTGFSCKLGVFVLLIPVSMVLAIVANTLRISTAIALLPLTKHLPGDGLHELQGAFIYFLLLCLWYFVIEYFLNPKPPHARTT